MRLVECAAVERVANLAKPGIVLAAQEEHRGPLDCKEHKGPNTGGNPMRSGAKGSAP